MFFVRIRGEREKKGGGGVEKGVIKRRGRYREEKDM